MFNSNYTTGHYVPTHQEKCINFTGTSNYFKNIVVKKKEITFRSSWEWKVCNFCDRYANVLEWGSEVLTIPYMNESDGCKHEYITDFLIVVKTKKGTVEKWVCEVKPDCQAEHFDELGRLVLPPAPKKKTQKTIANWQQRCDVVRKNHSKWTYARQWCRDNGYKFKILTETAIGVK